MHMRNEARVQTKGVCLLREVGGARVQTQEECLYREIRVKPGCRHSTNAYWMRLGGTRCRHTVNAEWMRPGEARVQTRSACLLDGRGWRQGADTE